MTNTNLQLEPPDNIARKQEQCEDQASVRQALVQPFILHTLGYDVFDPLTTMPDTTGATYDAELLHPDARVDYAIRRNGLPALLIAVHGPSTDLPDRIDEDAQVRLAQCMEQSTAEIGAITDGRRWTWHAKLQNTGTVAFHRTDLVHPTAEDIGIIEAISQTGWNKKTLMDYAQGVMYEARIQASLLKELSSPGVEFARWMASLVHQGPKSPKLLDLIHQRLPGAIEKALRTLQESDAEGAQNAAAAGGNWDDARSRPATQPMLSVVCTESNWTEPPAGTSQAGLLRHALDFLAQHPDADRIFETVPRLSRDFMTLSEVTRASPQRYWTRNGWYTTTVRRLNQKMSLINEIARKLGLQMKAVPTHRQGTEPTAQPIDYRAVRTDTGTTAETPAPGDDEAGTTPPPDSSADKNEPEAPAPSQPEEPSAATTAPVEQPEAPSPVPAEEQPSAAVATVDYRVPAGQNQETPQTTASETPASAEQNKTPQQPETQASAPTAPETASTAPATAPAPDTGDPDK